jgi:hypothetical protein
MKKTLILFAALFCCLCASAQDVILKKDGSEIKAKVLEITDLEIKYKEFDFQNGPTRNINVADVFMITYQNGRKELFNKQSESQSPAAAQNVAPVGNLKSEFDRIGRNDVQMLDFFNKHNFPNYHADFKSAHNLAYTGEFITGLGLGSLGGGLILVLVGGASDNSGLITSGAVSAGLGSVLSLIGTPIWVVGYNKKKRVKNDFAREYFGIEGYTRYKPAPTLNFGLTQNGIGLALNF